VVLVTSFIETDDNEAAADMAQLATEALRLQARGGAVRSLYQRGLTWVSFRPMPDLVCGIDFDIRKLPGLGLLSGTAQGVRHEHTYEDVQDGNDDFSLHMNLSGLSTVAGQGRELTLRDGEAMLLRYSESRTITRPGPVYHRIVRLPRASLAPLTHNIDDAVLRPIPRGAGALDLLANYVGALIHDPVIAQPDMRQLITAQLCDLVAVTLRATRDAVAAAEGRGIRAARLRAIKTDIEKHLAQSDLTPAVVARRQRISDSYIRKLFEGEGTSFSEFVLRRRLVSAHRMLTDPRSAGRSISSIAFDAGFGDLSYFNRTFKRFYGSAPSEIRAAIYREGV
jgi:AraC-like DNA-binding protein